VSLKEHLRNTTVHLKGSRIGHLRATSVSPKVHLRATKVYQNVHPASTKVHIKVHHRKTKVDVHLTRP
jgi:hypothetical protein